MVEGVRIRRLRKTDRKTVARIYSNVVQDYLASLDGAGYGREVSRERGATLVNLPPGLLSFYEKSGSSFVAESDGEIVGFILAQPFRWFDLDDRVLWLEYIAVVRGFRYRGVASALLESVREFGVSHKIHHMFTTLNPNNEASNALLSGAGFEVRNWRTARYADSV